MYLGLSIKPVAYWRFDFYADFYRFPWLRYQVSAPSFGKDFMAQATYKPSKKLEWYCRFHHEIKPGNNNTGTLLSSKSIAAMSVRCHLNFQINPSIAFRNRVELMWWNYKSAEKQHGLLAFAELFYRPMMKKLSGNIRLQVFETDGFDSRIYAYENDVLYSFSIPSNAGAGVRYYLNMNYDVTRNCSFWLKIARTIPLKDFSSKSLSENQVAGVCDLKLQMRYIFN
jgi:hypothetical protein